MLPKYRHCFSNYMHTVTDSILFCLINQYCDINPAICTRCQTKLERLNDCHFKETENYPADRGLNEVLINLDS
jgi:hypothetical protein